jgi:signal transduction histidine kinase
LLNLLSNAIKFSPTHDVVKVIVKAEKFDPTSVNVSITVVDFGIGINEKDQKNLFKPYFKTSDPKSQELNASSHGLGLNICYKIT